MATEDGTDVVVVPQTPTSTGIQSQKTLDPLLEDLLQLPLDARVRQIREDPARYAVAHLAERLLTKIADVLPEGLAEAHELAALAGLILRHAGSTPQAVTLFALSVAQQANALRAQGELLQSSSLMDAARFLLRALSEGDVNPLVTAEMDSLEGSLRKSQRRLGEAIRLHERAVAVYLRQGHQLKGARSLMALGEAYSIHHSVQEASRAYQRAHDLLAQLERPPRERLMALHSICSLLLRAGRISEAREQFEAIQDLYVSVPEAWARDRKAWLEGSLAFAEGNSEVAEERYRRAADLFASRDLTYSSALVGKDLAALYARQGRLRDLEAIVEEIVPIFEAMEVHFEADAARKILRDALGSRRDVN